MRRVLIGCFLLLVAAFAMYGFAGTQGGQLDAKQLRSMLVQLGYEVKDLNTEAGSEKYEVKIVKTGYDVYVAYEVSPSKNYVWLTVLLGDPRDSMAKDMLKENGKIQPSFFYVTSANKLMMGLPVDNRGITNTILRQRTDSITDNVVKTDKIWN
jgi:hypothetical protein